MQDTCMVILLVFWWESCNHLTVLWSLHIQTEKYLNENKAFEWKQGFWMEIKFLNENKICESKQFFSNEDKIFELK